VWAASTAPDGTVETQTPLSPDADSADAIEYAGHPTMAFAPDGRLVVAWVVFGYYRQTGEVTVRSRNVDGVWEPKVLLPPPPDSREAQWVDLAVDPTTGVASLVIRGDGNDSQLFHPQGQQTAP